MATNVTPVYVAKNGAEHVGMEEGQVVNPKFVSGAGLLSENPGTLYVDGDDKLAARGVSEQADNLLKTDLVGAALLTPTDVISADAGNAVVVGTDNKLFVQDKSLTTAADYRSEDEHNMLRIGTDEKLTIEAKDIISLDTKNMIGVDDNNLLIVDEERVEQFLEKHTTSVVSGDTDNSIKIGTDGKLYVKVVSDDAGNLITADSEGAAYFSGQSLKDGLEEIGVLDENGKQTVQIVSQDSANIIEEDTDKSALLTQTVFTEHVRESITSIGLIDASGESTVKVVSNDTGNLIKEDADKAAYFSGQDLKDQLTEIGVLDSNGNVTEINIGDLVGDGDTNLLHLDSDAKLHVDANDILSNEARNILGISPIDQRVYLGAKTLSEQIISQDADNILTIGSDDRLYAACCGEGGTTSSSAATNCEAFMAAEGEEVDVVLNLNKSVNYVINGTGDFTVTLDPEDTTSGGEFHIFMGVSGTGTVDWNLYAPTTAILWENSTPPPVVEHTLYDITLRKYKMEAYGQMLTYLLGSYTTIEL